VGDARGVNACLVFLARLYAAMGREADAALLQQVSV
jgi:hypothetical protein